MFWRLNSCSSVEKRSAIAWRDSPTSNASSMSRRFGLLQTLQVGWRMAPAPASLLPCMFCLSVISFLSVSLWMWACAYYAGARHGFHVEPGPIVGKVPRRWMRRRRPGVRAVASFRSALVVDRCPRGLQHVELVVQLDQQVREADLILRQPHKRRATGNVRLQRAAVAQQRVQPQFIQLLLGAGGLVFIARLGRADGIVACLRLIKHAAGHD